MGNLEDEPPLDVPRAQPNLPSGYKKIQFFGEQGPASASVDSIELPLNSRFMAKSKLASSLTRSRASYSTASLNQRAALKAVIRIQSAIRMWLTRRRFRQPAIDQYKARVTRRLAEVWAIIAGSIPMPALAASYDPGQHFCESALLDNGYKYVGEVLRGQRHGRGILISSENDVLCGTWHHNLNRGFSKLITSSNECFEGVMFEGRIQGEGKWQFPSGHYAGSFEKGLA
jgi:hypothetical protein